MDPTGLIFLVVFMGIFYFMLIRPQKRRAEQHRSLVSSLERGDEVVTIGGLYGTVQRIGDDDLDLEVAPGTTLRVLKTAIARRIVEDVDSSSVGGAREEEAQ